MDSPILDQQPSRRSLFQTPVAAPIPYARSTPTQFGVKQPNALNSKDKESKKDLLSLQDEQDSSLIRSPIDIKMPHFDSISSLSEEEVNKIPEYNTNLPKKIQKSHHAFETNGRNQ